MRKPSNVLIGIAGVHSAVSELTLKNLVALPTVRNTAGYDIVAGTPDGTGHAFLQVKTSLSKVKFWPVSDPDHTIVAPDVYYVFLRYIKEDKRFEGFLESSENVVKQVKANLDDYREQGKKEFPYWALPKDDKEQNRLKKAWEKWKP